MNRQRTISVSDEEVRSKMKKYWEVYEPSLESMMLSSEACYLSENEQNEVFSYLPSFKGLRVLELGAGIGRYTTPLAEAASHVVAVDFMESYTKENERVNGHHKNITFMCGDVTKLDIAPNSFDVVFSNWLLMYLTNKETEGVMNSVLDWLKPGGHFFFRESCYHQSGNRPRSENPTQYRKPLDYMNILRGCNLMDSFQFNLISAKNILTYIEYHGNPNQLCFLCQKASTNILDFDQRRLSLPHYVPSCSEEEETIKWAASHLNLESGQGILNVNCGTGSSSILLAKHSGAFVHGIDSNPLKIYAAIEQQGKLEKQLKSKMQFEFCDVSNADMNANSFDRILYLGNIDGEECGDKNLIKSTVQIAKNCLKNDGKILLSAFVSKENRSNIPDNTFTLDNLTTYLQDQELTIENISLKNSTALCWSQELLLKLKDKQSNSINKRSTQLEFQIQCLRDGTLDWVAISAFKNHQEE